MSDTTHNFLFSHGGMLQSERLGQAPDPGAMQFSGRTFEELVGRSAEFARSLVFYGDDNKPDGDWTAFFREVYDYDRKQVRTDVIDDMVRNASVPPHLALLFAFYRMLLVTQADMNTLTDRQLDFYFRNVLGFRMRKGTEGHVTVFAELGKNVDAVSIAKGLLFDAGKDSDGKTITYETVDELRLGKEVVAALAYYSVQDGFKREPVADAPAAAAASTAPAAGASAGTGAAGGAASADTPDKTHSLCIASAIFNIPGCDMTITFPACADAITAALPKLRAEYTSAEGWTAFTGNTLQIKKSMQAIACYDPKVHGGNLDTTDPVIRLSSDDGYGDLASLTPANLKSVSVDIANYCPPKLANKYGEVENRAEVNPFGPDGKKDDYFKVTLPFRPSSKPVISGKLNEGAVWEQCAEPHIFRIKDDSCDQALISKSYADLVIKAFTADAATDRQKAKTAMEKMKVTAVYPRLLSPIMVTTASGEGTVSGVFMQHPCGFDTVTDGTTLTKDVTLERQIATLSQTTLTLKNAQTTTARQEQEKGSALYIALTQIGTGAGQISLYLDNTGKAEGPANVQWSYRNGQEWVNFKQSAILKDTTCGLSQSGIVIFDCKAPLPAGDAGFLAGLPCIRALCDNGNSLLVKEVRPRAIELAYSETSVGAGPGGAPLPAETISKPVHSVVGVKAFSQPYEGEAGTRAENPVQFRRRVAERLRHKGRTWSTWDYETRILEAFPDISYVKCLPSCEPDGTATPGHVTVIIIPESSDDPLKPTPRIRLVNEVKKLLDGGKSSFATIDVIGPAYREVSVAVSIALRPGYNDATKYDALASDALTDYLRPWVGYRNGQRFKDGDGVSDIIAFLESLPFVDVIEEMKVTVDGEAVDMDGRIERTNAVSVLTSAPVHGVKCHTAD